MTPLLQVNDLEMRFPLVGSRKVVQAVNGVSLTIEKGQTLSLVGESGSGKTTIGRCVLGLLEPSGGEIIFDGQRMGRNRSIRSPGRSLPVSTSLRICITTRSFSMTP